ncbi:uncharacterized protein L201_006380 [Kwoniella dendrophila CBS 6074]|uniref:Glycosyltransferase family 49 protein n=1 Tax=Kwoniella dendrophila CBS 6074 TaxID=1295534 RepID=A0AAX4K2V0_9TREE
MLRPSRQIRIIIIFLCIGFSLLYLKTPKDHFINLDQFKYTLSGATYINISALFNHHISIQNDPLLDILSHKAFSNNIYDVTVFPYFRRKSHRARRDEVTLTTWATYDRFDRLIDLATRNQGTISVVIWIPPSDELATPQLIGLENLIRENSAISEKVDIHLVTSNRPLLHNTWRNIARSFATTDWVMLWDIDFIICTDFQAGLDTFKTSGDEKWVKQLAEGKAALVIPSFEWISGTEYHSCPKNKQDLVDNYRELKLDAFETSNPVLSHATDYTRYMQTDQPYKVTNFEFSYEVYAIFRKDINVWCDERFAGAGYNRAACTASMYLSGMDFYVLADQWTIHQPHKSTSFEMRNSYDTAVSWKTFRMDLCHSVADNLAIQGLLHSTEGERIRTLCTEQEIPEINVDLSRLLRTSKEVASHMST